MTRSACISDQTSIPLDLEVCQFPSSTEILPKQIVLDSLFLADGSP